MKIRTSLWVGLLALSIGGISAPMTASAEAGVYFSVAPPPLRYEVVPAPRRGYYWSPGYWDARSSGYGHSRHHSHAWQRGHWQRERHGYYYSEPSWTQRDDRWQFERGRWNRGDRDGDGVRNGRDRAPDNPRRY